MRNLLLCLIIPSVGFASNIQSGGSFINNTSTLQSGATFYVSSGTVSGPISVSTCTITGSGVKQTAAHALDIQGISGLATTGDVGPGIARFRSTSNNVFDFGTNPVSPFGGWIQAYDQRVGFTNKYPMAIDPEGGNVGIGTFNPATKLHMSSGTITIDGNVSPAMTITGSGQPTTTQALCLITGGNLGHCTSVVSSTGSCTCSSP